MTTENTPPSSTIQAGKGAWVRYAMEAADRWVRLRVSTAGLRRIDKLGLEAVLAEIKAKKATKG